MAFIAGSVQFFNDHGVSISTVKKLSNDPAEEKILYRSFGMTDEKSLNRNLNKLYWKSLSFIPRLLSMLAQNGEEGFWNYVSNNASSGEDTVDAPLSNGKILKTLFNKIWAEFRVRFEFTADFLAFFSEDMLTVRGFQQARSDHSFKQFRRRLHAKALGELGRRQL